MHYPDNFGKPIHEDQNTVPVLQSASKREIDPYEGTVTVKRENYFFDCLFKNVFCFMKIKA